MNNQTNGNQFDRLYVAVVTPFKPNFEVDEAALRKHLQYFMQPKFIDAGGAIIINPEAGEVFYMDSAEARRSIEIAMEECSGKVPVFAGASGLRTEDIVKNAVTAKELGVDGLFLMPPIGMMDITISWNADKYPEVFIDLAKAQVEATDLPAIVHPVGSQSPTYGIGFPLEMTLRTCKEIPNIVGWKMTYSYPGSAIIAKGLKSLDRHVAVLRATAKFFHENMANDPLEGTVSGSFNYAMEPMIEHINAWKQRDIDAACRIWKDGLQDLHTYVYADYSRLHIRYKLATWLRGLIPLPFLRPPVPKPRKEEITEIRGLMEKAGLSAIGGDAVNAVMKTL